MRYGRHARFWLVGLLVLTAVFAAGALFAKYKLESLRGVIQQSAEARTGARLAAEAVSVTGLRGFRIQNFDVVLDSAPGASVEVHVPELVIYIDLTDLFYGGLTVERVVVDGAVVRVDASNMRTWLSESTRGRRGTGQLGAAFPARVVGRDCRLEVSNLAGGQGLSVSGVEFDVSRVPDSGRLTARVVGAVEASEARSFEADLDYSGPDDFELEVACSSVSAEDVNAFVPPSRQVVESGTLHPRLRVDADGSDVVDVSLEATFGDVCALDYAEFVEPASGTLDAFATFNRATRHLTVRMATLDSEAVQATVAGTVALGNGAPEFDLRLQAGRLPLEQVARHYAAGYIERYGTFDFVLREPHSLSVTLSGTAAEPVVTAAASVSAADLSFSPKRPNLPGGTLRLGRIEAAWDSATGRPQAQVIVLDGKARDSRSGVEVRDVSGTVRLTGRRVEVDPLNARVSGQPFVAAASYDLDTKEGTASLSGTLTGIEDTLLHSGIKKTELGGSATVNARATAGAGRYILDADVDASQTRVGYDWWFLKPAGIGASGSVHAEIVPFESMTVDATASLAGSQIEARSELTHNGQRWLLQRTVSRADRLDAATVGDCLRVPLLITEGTATDCRHEWLRVSQDAPHWDITMACDFDKLTCQAVGAEYPFRLVEGHVTSVMKNREEREGTIELTVEEATTPPFGTTWLVPLRDDPEMNRKYPQKDRFWTYELAARSISVPPWKGTDFSGAGHGSMERAGLDRYEAAIDGGRLVGSYERMRAENAYEARVEWSGVPAIYFIKHLDLPEVLTGPMDGEAKWTQDCDDPGTLEGLGRFEIRNGQFSADYLVTQLEQMESEGAFLPPSLKFSLLEADVSFRKDLVKTPSLELVSEGIRLRGSGQFVTDGDMDYDIRVAISPDVAERIPMLRDSINVQGHRLAQQDIELAFKLTGPTFKPRSTLSEAPPITVTLVTGALEVTSTALQVIDTPRKLLVDLLKIGGGIVGVRKQPGNGSS